MSDNEENKFNLNEDFQNFKKEAEKAEKELKKLCAEMMGIAKEVKEEYSGLDDETLNSISGSVTQIHEDSPFLDEFFEGDSWKKVIKNIPDLDLSKIKFKKQKDIEKEEKDDNEK